MTHRPRKRPQRVAVMSPQTRLALARRTRSGRRSVLTADFDRTRARAAHRSQLRPGVLHMALLGGLLFALPVVLSALPALMRTQLAGVPVAWWLLGTALYPVLLLLGRSHLRAAERAEAGTEDRR